MTVLPTPSQCRLWRDPQATLALPMDAAFELAETLCEESHWWRYVLVCRTCGQHYLFEFHEEVDWSQGNDAMYTTYAPVTGRVLAHDVHRRTPRGMLHTHKPALLADTPMGGSEKRPVWTGA